MCSRLHVAECVTTSVARDCGMANQGIPPVPGRTEAFEEHHLDRSAHRVVRGSQDPGNHALRVPGFACAAQARHFRDAGDRELHGGFPTATELHACDGRCQGQRIQPRMPGADADLTRVGQGIENEAPLGIGFGRAPEAFDRDHGTGQRLPAGRVEDRASEPGVRCLR